MGNVKKKTFICEICNSHFKRKSDLAWHISSVHEGKKLFRCEMCQKNFTRKNTLTQHKATVHEGKNHSIVIFVTTDVLKRVV